MFSSDTTQVSDGGYQISRSLRFNSADSAYLNRTPASATNRRTWTLSTWAKVSAFGSQVFILGAGVDGDNRTDIRFDGDSLQFVNNVANVTTANLKTTAVYRDPSAWYHIVIAVDSTQATSTNRIKIYVNGVEVTSFSTSTYFSQNTDTFVNNNCGQTIGRYSITSSNYFNGYMTEFNLIDGSQLTPSSFGETNAQTGVWQPKAYSGSYGTNGFYLNFSDNSNTTAATLGKDYSGNGNNWTPNNFSVTAGTGNDSLVDSPTSYGTDTGAGGTVRGNYCTLNPLYRNSTSTAATLANGNLDLTTTGGVDNFFGATFSVNSGKWYYECLVTATGTGFMTGICSTADISAGNGGNYRNTGDIYNLSGTSQTSGATYTANDLIGVAIDIDAGTVQFYKNNTAQGATPSFTFTAGTSIFVRGRSDGSGASATFNFGQRPFAYTAPSGFKALCTQNLPVPTIGATTATLANKYFDAVLWTGTGTQTRSITGLDFQPDLTWMKIRADTPQGHQLYDVVRGAGGGKNLSSNTTAAEGTVNGFPDSDYGYVSSFDSGGFSVNDGAVATTGGYVNYSGRTYVAWNWKANGAGSTNTAGSITSTVSANTTSGFSVVTYTGTGANATVGHGIGIAPSMVIIKARSFTQVWVVGHSSIGFGNYLLLNATDASASGSNVFNSTAPTSTVFSLGSGGGGNQSAATYVAYCFAEVAGYSKFGSYTGNGSTDGPFIYTGFRPAFILTKKTTGAGGYWLILDVARNTVNSMTAQLWPNGTDAENNDYGVLDSVSNGFKLRNIAAGYNDSAAVYLYMAFASNPFKYSLAR